jgi:membrane-associated protein
MDLITPLSHSLPVLFACTAICCFGVPMPGLSLALMVAGALAQRGKLSLALAIAGTVMAAVAGDQLGFWLARLAGPERLLGWADRFNLRKALQKAVDYQNRVQGASIFLSRWLVPLGPWINFNCGITAYPAARFLVWSLLGQTFWVLLYMLPGYFLQSGAEQITKAIGALGWAILGVLFLALKRTRHHGWESQHH